MRFVVSKGDTNNPEFLGIVIPPSTPGFKHARTFPRGFRFEVTDAEHIRRVKEGQFAIEDDGTPRSAAEIAKIDADVAAEVQEARERAKRNAPKPKVDWGRVGAIAGVAGVAAAVLIYLLSYLLSR